MMEGKVDSLALEADALPALTPLTSALLSPRVSHRKGRALDPTQLKSADGGSIAIAQLPLLRVDNAKDVSDAKQSDSDLVKGLAHDVLAHTQKNETSTSTKQMSGVRAMEERRKIRHDDARRDFESFQQKLYDESQGTVLKASRALQDDMQSLDVDQAQLFARVNDPAIGVDKDHAWLESQHQTIVSMESRRSVLIRTFATCLETVESGRLTVITGTLKRLAAQLIDIAYVLEPEVERIIDEYAHDVNVLVAENRKAHVEVVSRLERKAVEARVQAEHKWAQSEAAWMLLKHNDTVMRFNGLLDSDEYVNPPSRIEAFRRLYEGMSQTHAHRRLPLLQALLQLRPPQLTTPAVDGLRVQILALEEEDFAATASSLNTVKETQHGVQESARARMEELRFELHTFSALAPSGNLDQLCSKLRALTEAPELEDTFRKMLGLKLELLGLCTVGESKEVLFSNGLQGLQQRVHLLVQARQLGPAADQVGRGAERKALLSVVDSMRSMKRTDLPAALVNLHRLASSLVRLPGLHEAVTSRLTDLLDEVADAIDEVNESLAAANIPVPPAIQKFLFPDDHSAATSIVGGSGGSVVGSTTRRGRSASRSRRGSDAGRSVRSGRSQSRSASREGSRAGSRQGGSRQGSEGARSRSKSTRSRRSKARTERGSMRSEMTDPLSTVMGAVLPMSVIRSLQKDFALIVGVSDLPAEIHRTLDAILAACGVQEAANEAVDGVLRDNAWPRLELRSTEGSNLLQRAGQAIDVQQARLRDAGERLAAWMGEVAKSLEDHVRAQQDADDSIKDELASVLEAFTAVDVQLEDAYIDAERLVREAPVLPQLDVRTQQALRALDAIEAHYNTYAETAIGWSKVHVERAASVLRAHRTSLCKHFGLAMQPEQAVAVDGQPIPGEQEPGKLAWTVQGPINKEAAVEAAGARLDSASISSVRTQDEPSALEPLRHMVAQAGVQSVAQAAGEGSLMTLPLPSVENVSLKFSSTSLQALHLEGAIVPAPVHPSATAAAGAGLEYTVSMPSELLADFFSDADAVLRRLSPAPAPTVPTPVHAPVAEPVAAEAPHKAAAPAKGASPGKAAAKSKNSKHEQEEEAARKKAEEQEAARIAAEREEAERREAEMLAEAEAKRADAADAVFKHGLVGISTGMPLDPDGMTVVPLLVIPRKDLASWLTELRGYLLQEFEQYAAERRIVSAELATSRIAGLTSELDHRLRHHKPRKGILEVNVRALREEELVLHRSRLARHIRRVGELEVSAEDVLHRALLDSQSAIVDVLASLKEMQEGLKAHTSLATLQASASRARQLRSQYEQDFLQRVTAMRGHVHGTCAKLREGGDAFIAQCVLFPSQSQGQTSGPDACYDREEVSAYAREVDALAASLEATRQVRVEKIDGLQKQQQDSLASWDTFFAAYDQAHKELCLRDGLGARYGAPRRTAAQAMRTVVIQSEAEADVIDARIAELRSLLTECNPGQTARFVKPALSGPISSQLDEEIAILRASKGLHLAAGAPLEGSKEESSASAKGGDSTAKPAGGKVAVPAKAAAKAAPAASKSGGKGAKEAALSPADAAAAELDAKITAATRGMTAEGVRMAIELKHREIDEAHLDLVGYAPLSVRIRRVVQVLRDAVYSRAVHVQALKTVPDAQGPLRKIYLPFISLSDVPPGVPVRALGLAGHMSAGAPSTAVWPQDERAMPPVHTPVQYPSVAAQEACILPVSALAGGEPGSAPPPSAAVLVTPAAQALADSADVLAPHSIKGPSPSHAQMAASVIRPTLVSTVMSILDKCKAETKELYAAEGLAVTSDDQLSDSFRTWTADQSGRIADLREFSARRLREQVDSMTELLAEAPAVLVSDVVARSQADSDHAVDVVMSEFKAKAAALEQGRVAHVNALRLKLADPAAKAELQALLTAESERVAELRKVITSARLSALLARHRYSRNFALRLLHNVSLFCLTAEEVLVRADLAPLPGDEHEAPRKMSFKRLHRALRKAGRDAAAVAAAVLGEADAEAVAAGGAGSTGPDAEGKDGRPAPGKTGKPSTPASGRRASTGGAAVAAPAAAAGSGKSTVGTASAEGGVLAGQKAAVDVFAQRAWPGVTHPDLLFGSPPAVPVPAVPAAVQAPPAGASAAAAGKAGERPTSGASKAAPASKPSSAASSRPTSSAGSVTSSSASAAGTGSTEDASPPLAVGAVTCTYAPWSRHAIRTRDEVLSAFAAQHHAAVGEIEDLFSSAGEAVAQWEQAWGARSSTLVAGSLTTAAAARG